MEETKTTPAIILNRVPYRENDSLVGVYTAAYGKLLLVARGTLKTQSKLAAHLEPISLANIMIIYGRGFDYIGGAVSQEVYLGIRTDLNKLYYAGQALKIFNELVKGDQADKRLFFLLVNWLALLDNYSDFDKEKGSLLFSFFILKFLVELGYQPEMYKCLLCKNNLKPGNNYFDLLSGGVVCEACFNKGRRLVSNGGTDLLPVSDNCIKLIRFMLDGQFERPERIKVDKKLTKELANLVNKFLIFFS